MKHSFFSKVFVAMSIMMTSALVFVSCDGDDNGEIVNPYETKSLVCDHILEVSEDYLDFYDITITYQIDGGSEMTEEVDSELYSYTFNFDADMMELPTKISGVITAAPKSTVPEYEQEKVYYFNYSSNFKSTSTRKDGETTVLPPIQRSQSLPVSGSKINELLGKGTVTLTQFEFTR